MNWYDTFVSGRRSPYRFSNFYDSYIKPWAYDVLGYSQKKNTQESLSAQIDYDQYLKAGNQRALSDWKRNLPGRHIKYPEFSYPGQIRRADTSITRARLDYDTARANYSGNFLFRTSGLYHVGTGLYRSM